ncbi:hypothetical protein [Nitratireductor indicus]|uniref:hypothetical protein n=1 Tax=Nitratireductor indicus TaxID=721133 RepID=UPI002876E660|nr:hypothetical protein [Nitratireductor indicus]MDS1135603.1 hypothetical protein [Nitratireductor indicus]
MDSPDFSDTRQWWPSYLMGEVMPAGRARPEDWLRPDGDGKTTVLEEDDEDRILMTIEPGEVVEFCWHERRGSVSILLMPNGSWELCAPADAGTIDMFTGQATTPNPAASIDDANWFAEQSDYETMMDTMDDFASAYAAMGDIEAEGREIVVDAGFWSNGIAFRVSTDGKHLEAIQ